MFFVSCSLPLTCLKNIKVMSCFCVYERSPLKSIEVGLMHRRRGGTESTPGGSGFTKGRQIIGVKAESESEWKRKSITRIGNAVPSHNLLRRQSLNVSYSSFQVSVDDDILWGFWFLRHCCLHHVSTDSWLDWFGVNFKHRNILQIIEKLKSIIRVRTLSNRCLQLYLKVYFMFDLKVNLCIAVPIKQCRQ